MQGSSNIKLVAQNPPVSHGAVRKKDARPRWVQMMTNYPVTFVTKRAAPWGGPMTNGENYLSSGQKSLLASIMSSRTSLATVMDGTVLLRVKDWRTFS